MKVEIIERALQLADSGVCRTISEIRTTLRNEGYINIGPYLEGQGIRRQVRSRITSAHAAAEAR